MTNPPLPRRYQWPWFVLAAAILGIVLAIIWMMAAVKRARRIRESTIQNTLNLAPAPEEKVKAPFSTNGMVWIPAGKFLMGSPAGQADEKPVHAVHVDGFWMDETE